MNHAIAVTREGTITVDVKEIYEDEKLRIEVVDQGPQLEADEQVDVFQPSMGSPGTSKRGTAAEGEGLSLYVVRMLVELQVCSSKGFPVLLPVAVLDMFCFPLRREELWALRMCQ